MKQAPIIGSIVIAVAIIFTAVIMTPSNESQAGNAVVTTEPNNDSAEQALVNISGGEQIGERHIYGSPDADVTIVEFSDLECPFCARLHPTLKSIVDDSNGTINWEYRHFPLSIHANAKSAALASECIASLGGNEAFWDFTTAAFDNQRGLGNKFYEETAVSLGINANAFSLCMDSEQFASDVEADAEEALASGARGTPFGVIVTKDGRTQPFSGALPASQLQDLIDSVS